MIRRHNVPGLAAGVLVTTVTTALLAVLPELVPSEAISIALFRLTGEVHSGNPFRQLRLFGGLPGGIVAGTMVRDVFGRRDASTSAKYGAMAALLGLLATYFVTMLIAVGLGVSPLLFALLPLFAVMVPVYLPGGIVGAFLGVWLGGTFFPDDDATA